MTSLKRTVFAVAMAGAALAATPALAAPTLYGLDDTTNTLIRIDGATGARTVVGATGIAAGEFGDLAYDATTGTAYWVPGRDNGNLYTLNLTTGAATLIGAHGLSDAFGLAFDTANNTLYASTGGAGQVYRLNTGTGAATLVGNSGFFASGLDYSGANGLVGIEGGGGRLFQLNPATGAGTQISAGVGFINDSDLAYDASTGSYYVVDYSGYVYQYDNAFTSRTLLSQGGPLSGIIVTGAQATGAVPEPATWAMMLLGFGGVGYSLRRRTKVSARVRFA